MYFYNEIKQHTNYSINYGIEILRIIGFIGVFVEHVGLYETGTFSVSLFFMISGFTSMASKKSYSTVLQHIKGKMGNLYDVHLVTMFLSIPLLISKLIRKGVLISSIPNLSISFLGNVSLTTSLFPRDNIYFSFNSVSWFLSSLAIIQLFFYFLKAKIMRLDKEKSFFYIIVIFLVQTIIAYISKNIKIVFINDFFITDDFLKWLTYIFPLYRFGDFLIGAFICNLYILYKQNFNKNYLSIITSCFLLILGFILSSLCNADAVWGYYSIIFVPISSSVLLLMSLTSFKKKYPIVFFLGRICGYSFLVHQLVIKYVTFFFNKINLNINLLTYLFELVITIIISCFIYYHKIKNKVS